MKRTARILTAALIATAVLLPTAAQARPSIDQSVTCGPGFTQVGQQCIPRQVVKVKRTGWLWTHWL